MRMKPVALVLLVLAETLALLGMIGMRQWTLASGQRLVLRALPVDPRSLFQGDYVIFTYDISTIRLDGLAGDSEFEPGEPVYVVLRQTDGKWQPAAAWRSMPATADGVVLKGQVRYVNQSCRGGQGKCRELHAAYGIEHYFVPEGKGGDYTPGAEHRVEIEVAVDRFGHAAIAAFLVNGEVKAREGLL